jgi:transposase InsO family protein
MASLCVEFGISRPTGYLWLGRYREGGINGIGERSRRPHSSPTRTEGRIEDRIVALRRERPDWGARKLAVLLGREGFSVPASTVHDVLLRRGLVRAEDRHPQAIKRFEREQPNQLWQMDFKSPKGWDQNVGPLSVLDDATRYVIALDGTWTTRAEAVQERLTTAFLACGLPDAMLMDHGTPWWNTKAAGGWSQLTVWLMKQDIQLHFCAIRHPQTQGKVERFHGALESARRRRGLPEPEQHQNWLDSFRHEYNHVRPHEALAMQAPAGEFNTVKDVQRQNVKHVLELDTFNPLKEGEFTRPSGPGLCSFYQESSEIQLFQ